MPVNISGTTLGQSTKDATATPDDVVKGKIFYGSNGKEIGLLIHKKSLILAENPACGADVWTDTITIKWAKPTNSEIEIAKYNVYFKQTDVAPASLNELEKIAEVDSDINEYVVDGLDPGKTYFFIVESVSIDGYENASMRNLKNIETISCFWFTGNTYNSDTDKPIYQGKEGSWELVKNKDGSNFDNRGNMYLAYYDDLLFSGCNYSSGATLQIYDFLKQNAVHSIGFRKSGLSKLLFTNDTMVYLINDSSGTVIYYSKGRSNMGTNWKGIEFAEIWQRSNVFCVKNNIVYIFNWGGGRYVADITKSSSEGKSIGQTIPGGYVISTACAYGMGRFIVGYDNGKSVYILEDKILEAETAVVMTEDQPDSAGFLDIIYADKENCFYGIKNNGTTWKSSDGVSWNKMNTIIISKPTSSGSGSTYKGGYLAYFNGTVMCGGNGYQMWKCINGADWVVSIGPGNAEALYGICSKY